MARTAHEKLTSYIFAKVKALRLQNVGCPHFTKKIYSVTYATTQYELKQRFTSFQYRDKKSSNGELGSVYKEITDPAASRKQAY